MPEELDANGLFALRLRSRRVELGWTMTELANRAGVSGEYISLIEEGKVNTSLDKGFQLAAAVGLDLADMIAPCNS